MAGIYIHIPFCKQKCYYCDFYSVAWMVDKSEVLNCIFKEIEMQQNYLKDEIIESIYIGGGTPSILKIRQLENILNQIRNFYKLSDSIEITIEVNPDDLDLPYLMKLVDLQINRISIGIQSFNDDHLKYMHRRHTEEQATEAVYYARKAGFRNISIDLIYGLPGMTLEQWEENLNKALALAPDHISAYHLTIEPKTIFGRRNKRGTLNPIDEEDSLAQYKLLIKKFKDAGYEQYEISNFAKEGRISRHNSNYWKDRKYLGIGPSAHSYDHISRQWNIASITRYVDSIKKGILPIKIELLDEKDKINEYIMTSLRTKWGIDLSYIENIFGKTTAEQCLSSANKYIETGKLIYIDNTLKLTEEGIFISDRIIREMFV